MLGVERSTLMFAKVVGRLGQTLIDWAVTLSHSAVRRARSWDKAERSRLIAMALPPGW